MKKMNEKITPKNIKIASISAYIFLLIGGAVFVHTTLNSNTEEVSILEDDNNEEEEAIKPVKPYITFEINGRTKEYQIRMENNQTILDLIDYLRQEGEIQYEKVAYSYGTEISSIDGVAPEEGENWHVYLETDSSNAADQMKNLKLSPKETALLKRTINNPIDVTFDIEKITLVNEAKILVTTRSVTPQ